MEVEKNVDLARYMGRWYEIASIPSRNQPKNSIDTRATYKLNEDGTVHVLNETWSDGKRGFIEGSAYKADPKSDEAKLKVKFYVPPFLPIIPVTGDYWVLYLDEDYQYALIGQPSKKSLWLYPCLCQKLHKLRRKIICEAKPSRERNIFDKTKNLKTRKKPAVDLGSSRHSTMYHQLGVTSEDYSCVSYDTAKYKKYSNVNYKR
ncbi:hypothetical protein OSB04_021181 [Centaurea solstitialis]|uniref:Lipocalin/cytosolic fatty-acid binding domain-containing protein n=1 Tax=Centaurea solstitialis TaxID=347529 RepID=A0AA38SU23_9ASTR|nr:hypothetical protein OSB04_021181 [Centaurea solstitialis]